MEEASYQIKWIRPYDLILDFNLTKEICMKYPFNNINKLKNFIIKIFNDELCPVKFKNFNDSDEFDINELEKNPYSLSNKKLLKHLFRFFEPENFKIVNFIKRIENSEEIKIRIENEEKNFIYEWKAKQALEEANSKKKAKDSIETKPPVIKVDDQPKMIKEFLPSNIYMGERYCDFAKWVGSIFQTIKDLNITDVNNVRILFYFIKAKRNFMEKNISSKTRNAFI